MHSYCQGLEVDYIGVIVGSDLIVRNGTASTHPASGAKSDRSVAGYKKLIAEKPEHAKGILCSLVKNTYRTLMTRGMKGCYVYFVDAGTEKFFRSRIENSI